MTSVDVHAHYFPELYLDMLDEFHGSPAGTAGLRGAGGGGTPAEIEARLAAMDAAGIDVQLLSAPPLVPYFDDATQALGAARVANAAYTDLIRAHPDRFRALAALPLPNGLAAGDELGRAMDELGFLGAAVTTTVLGRPLSDREFVPLFDALERRGAVLLVHPTGGESGQRAYEGLDLTAYPSIRLITTGSVPPERPLNALHHHAVADADGLRRAAVTFGPERLLPGSGYPYRTQGEAAAVGSGAAEFLGL
ncbi:putative amidohydrolase (aminocarboxymuconate-semialdehyde decarboxylase) [Streptomyces spiroverticillatus]|uniref:Amidohydrolase (Aminocarboxymuconate-semialdehyde decarboxylase) n=1 Tax=Streptomyces finlayi TaxID=67296 RepID=A0A918WSW6_9ACTN|nr:amidohydrolase family protein [Streptomyces finlayi]GGZ88634.1 putative amidohydrolase (aminocarboxymuconate-semialdehyde decarboxylase) [Streptomyces spiroverticillatus]GHC79608.1 putative amidohydrolase (aminocarboxymuconate-semialdehyde decarboxylase) [Streptomyces finlayi]